MRALLIGVLPATLIGCSCLVPPQAGWESCTLSGCPDRITARAPIELPPAPFKSSPATAKTKPVMAAKMAKPPSAPRGNRGDLVEEKAHSQMPKTQIPAQGPPVETSDPVLKKAKTTIAAKMEDPASAEFSDMKRAVRKNTFGKPVDTICGHIKGKKPSGEDTGERPFLYLVKEDEAYVVDGKANSAAAIAYRNICTSTQSRGKELLQQQKRQ